MRIATWNINNRVGRVRFRPEAAHAAIALDADVIVFNEYYPQTHSAAFCQTLSDAGWSHQMLSRDTGEVANRVLIASRMAIADLELAQPAFDLQFPANLLCVRVPSVGISLVGVRVPWYGNNEIGLVVQAWDWIESAATHLFLTPALILGDLNAGLKSSRSRGGDNFRGILQTGWHRATPGEGASFFGEQGPLSEIDHILGTPMCAFDNARYVASVDGFELAGSTSAISDHAALVANVKVLDVSAQPIKRTVELNYVAR